MVDTVDIRRSFDRWLDHRSPASRLVRDFSLELNRSGKRGFVLGGLIRDAVLSGPDVQPKDVDIAVDAENDAELESLWRACGLRPIARTSFGGIRVDADGVKFDLWLLRDTWAFRQGLIRERTFLNLPRTTSLNIEAVAVELSGARAVVESGFVAALAHRVIEVNLEPFPSVGQVIVRAQALSAKLGFDLGPRLSHLMQR